MNHLCAFLLLLLVPMARAAILTVYQTNYHTEVATQTHTNTLIVTQWTTSLQHYEEPTTTTTSTILTTVTIDTDSEDFATEILNIHNTKRQQHVSTPNLVWSDTVAASAQSYAKQYNCSGILTHSHGQYGENLALGYNATSAVEAWYDELSLYDWNDPVFGEDAGHFTQVVWVNTTYLGCGWLDCGSYYGQYTVCQYDAPGNYAGQFEENVMPLST